jgi:uncharacterized protein YozE (UPF0346 family)
MNYYLEKGFSVLNVIFYFNIINCKAQKRSDDKSIFADINIIELIRASWVISICILVVVCLLGVALSCYDKFYHWFAKRRQNRRTSENVERANAEQSVIPR